MKNVTFTVTVKEANMIFKALSKFPFEEVFELIGKLNEQSNQQLQTPSTQNNHGVEEEGFKLNKPMGKAN